jgi:hypothetical protein
MNKEHQMLRRQFLKTGGTALATLSVLAVSGRAIATTNASLRASLKYQDKPLGDKSCANCSQFVTGPSAKGPGGCKLMAGDTEISASGYCIAWVKKT